jgi:hypothetical protein
MSDRTRAYIGLTGAAFVFGASFVVIKAMAYDIAFSR